jgi:hypothetical protein
MVEPELVDFDAFRAESDDAPLMRARVGGRTIDIARPSAKAVLDFFRAGRDAARIAKLPPLKQTELAEGLFRALFGKQYDELEVAGATNAEMNELAGRVCARAMNEGAPPNRKARRAATKRPNRSTSSPDGRSSKRTSSANTGSTSASI